ncbi:MAG: Rab family GTPase, partial [Candidatus Helarchaeota archaeon]
ILMYDITRKTTFKDILDWKKDMSRHIKRKVPMILVGNKCDLESKREVQYEEGLSLQKKLKANAFYETSALRNINVQEVFLKLISLLK